MPAVTEFATESAHRIGGAREVADHLDLDAIDRPAEDPESGNGDDRKNQWHTNCLCHHDGSSLPDGWSHLQSETGADLWDRSYVE